MKNKDRLQKEKTLKKIETNNFLKCQDCHKRKEDVVETTCPYAKEICDKIVEAVLCKECYHERCMAI
jgi:hypothetical protein